MSDEIRIPCNCGNPDCKGYSLDQLGRPPFFVNIDRTMFDEPDTEPESTANDAESLAFAIVRTSSFDFEGERTDVHDIFAVLWGAYLRVADISNSQLFSERGFGIPSEIYSRAVIPIDWGKEHMDVPSPLLKMLLGLTSVHVRNFIERIFSEDDIDPILNNRSNFEDPPWLSYVRDMCGVSSDESYELQTRQWPLWTCFTEIEAGLTVVEISTDTASRIRYEFENFIPSTTTAVGRKAFKTPGLRNAVRIDVLDKLVKVARAVDQHHTDQFLVVPMASHVMLVGSRSLVCIADDCGSAAFNDELLKIENRRSTEADFFYTDVICEWTFPIDDERFEELIGELVKAERGVVRIRQVGSTREADDGRDLIAEWISPQTTSLMGGTERSMEKPLDKLMEVLIQVKIRSKGVGRKDASGLRDSLEHHDCSGLLFVAFPNVTTTLNDHLQKMRRKKSWWIDWWNRIDIEDRLRRNTDIADRYSDIVLLKKPSPLS